MSMLWPWSKQREPTVEEESPGLRSAKLAQVESTRELAAAEQQRVVSQVRRITLAEIRRNNHFTPSIFPEVK